VGREEGTALFEFAMVLPLLGIMLVAILFGGITFFNYNQLTNAVAVGARTLATGLSQGTGAGACTAANTALTNAAGNLTPSLITIAPESFVNGSSCSGTLIKADAATITATYPCNLPIPFTSMNLCPMQGGASSPVQGGVTLCTTPYCISATTTVYIE
jgi:Flp pilus assembly protein TadG